MPERGFDTSYWSDPFIQNLPKDAKLLYAYLWTNNHCNQAGLYEITTRTIAFDTALAEEDIPQFLQLLELKVKWYPDQNLIWVKNFIKRQSKSPKFLIAVAKSLELIHHNGAVKELLNYNMEKYSISIPYRYYIDSVPIPSSANAISGANASSKANSKKEKIVKEEEEILTGLARLRGWQADDDDVLWLQGLRSEFPGFTLAEFKACVDYNEGRPLPKHKGIWKNRFRNWMIKKREFESKGRLIGRLRESGDNSGKYTKGRYGHMVASTQEDLDRINVIRKSR